MNSLPLGSPCSQCSWRFVFSEGLFRRLPKSEIRDVRSHRPSATRAARRISPALPTASGKAARRRVLLPLAQGTTFWTHGLHVPLAVACIACAASLYTMVPLCLYHARPAVALADMITIAVGSVERSL